MRATVAPIVLSLLCLTVSAAPARAETNRHELWIGGSARALRSPSANALTDANLSGSSVGYAHDLGISLVPGSAIWLEASLTTGTADGTMFQSLTTELASFDLTGGLRARYALHRLIVASARVDLGAQRVRVDIAGAGTSASDHSWGPVASAGAALDLFAKASAPFGIGMRVELGYVLAPGVSLTPQREVSDDMILLPSTAFALGKLDLGGPSFTASLVGQF
jgi:hypothetical protein